MTTIFATTAPFVTELTGKKLNGEFLSNMKGPLVTITGYDEYQDVFEVTIATAAPCDDQRTTMPAQLLCMLIREYGEPHEFLNRTYLISEPNQ